MTMRTQPFWIGTSWKMNKSLGEAQAFCNGLLKAPEIADPLVQPFVIPPFTAVREVAGALEGTRVLVGAQNMHWAENGPWTGEISASMLVDCGAGLVELGHSERRAHFGETDETVGRKVATALRHGLVPLVCLGESAQEKERGEADRVLERQALGALSQLDAAGGDTEGSQTVIFAYEPVWAIGEQGVPATADYVEARHRHIRDVVGARMKKPSPCLYGGSVNRDNVAELAACAAIDGLFIGRAAWDVRGYLELMRLARSALA